MARYTWTVTLDEQPYTVELEHGLVSGKRLIYVNEQLVHESSKFWDFGTSKHFFPIGEHNGEITIKSTGRQVTYDLDVDGMPQETRKLFINVRKSSKYWGGLFVFFVVLVDLNGLQQLGTYAGTMLTGQSLAAVVACLLTAFTGWRVANNRTQSVPRRILICAILIALNFFILVGLLASLMSCRCIQPVPAA
jgi:hypothetical protein